MLETLFLKNSSSNSKKHPTRRTITSRASSHSYVSTRDNNEEQQEAHTRWRLNSRTSRSPNSRKRSLCSIKMATGPSRRKSSVRYLSRVIACRVVNNSPSLSNRIGGGVVCSRFGPFSLSLFPLVVSRLFSFSIALSRVAKKTRGTRPMAQRERERERDPSASSSFSLPFWLF